MFEPVCDGEIDLPETRQFFSKKTKILCSRRSDESSGRGRGAASWEFFSRFYVDFLENLKKILSGRPPPHGAEDSGSTTTLTCGKFLFPIGKAVIRAILEVHWKYPNIAHFSAFLNLKDNYYFWDNCFDYFLCFE